MRVIAGEFRSRKLKSLPGLDTRPTPDRLRETLFDVLQPRIEGVVFVDAYAGTGAVGIEALSRGAARAIFMERDPRAVEVIRENVAALGLESRAKVAQGSARLLLVAHPGEIVFLDPPYDREREYALALGTLGENPPLIAVAQHSKFFEPAEDYGKLHRTRTLKQGDNVLSFYTPNAATPSAGFSEPGF